MSRVFLAAVLAGLSAAAPLAAAAGLAAPLPSPQDPAAAQRPLANPPGEPADERAQVVSRLVAYVREYRERYSAVVAEEDYRQSAPAGRVRLRSDLLLVKSQDEEGWVSFRDVFEVDGSKVRDREDRLQKLFLDPATEAREQLRQIKEESARYNIGDVVRNVNVPLFPLVFLDPLNVPRFRFEVSGRRKHEGVAAWEVEYEERERPTLVRTRDGGDVAARGWFLVDPFTGAVLQSAVFYGDTGGSAETVVRYRLDAALGMWVPLEMVETYRDRSGMVLLRGEATYSRFRRFQVTTEEKVKIGK